MTRPCSGRGPPPSVLVSSSHACRKADCAGLPSRNAAARPPVMGCCVKWIASPIQGASRMMPGRRNRSQGDRAAAAAAFNRPPRGPLTVMNVQPAMSATVAVSSVDPPSATKTSLTTPAVAPGTKAARVRTNARSESSVAMMTLSIPLPIASARRCHELTVPSQA